VYPGTTLTTIVEPIHRSEEFYPNAEEFDGFRFSRMEEKKVYSTTTSTEFLMFSHGKHAWLPIWHPILMVVPDDFLR